MQKHRYASLAASSLPTTSPVDVSALGLDVGTVRAADQRSLVPVQAQPAERVVEDLVRLLEISPRVGVLDPQHEGSPVVPGEYPVEQGAAYVADVQVAGRGRGEPYAHLTGRQVAEHRKVVTGRGLAVVHCSASFGASSGAALTTGLVRVPIPSMSTLTSCPGSIGPTPAGVPVKITSPGSSVV